MKKIIEELKEELKSLPGVGEKTALRYAYALLELSKEKREDMIKAIQELSKIRYCEQCYGFSTTNICERCASSSRQKDTIILVSGGKDVERLASLGFTTYSYFVLGGLIDPLANKRAEDLRFEQLLERIKQDNVKEIIIALPQTSEGEITASYLKTLLVKNQINLMISKLAQGIPIGGSLEYVDEFTLIRSIEQRQELK